MNIDIKLPKEPPVNNATGGFLTLKVAKMSQNSASLNKKIIDNSCNNHGIIIRKLVRKKSL